MCLYIQKNALDPCCSPASDCTLLMFSCAGHCVITLPNIVWCVKAVSVVCSRLWAGPSSLCLRVVGGTKPPVRVSNRESWGGGGGRSVPKIFTRRAKYLLFSANEHLVGRRCSGLSRNFREIACRCDPPSNFISSPPPLAPIEHHRLLLTADVCAS